MSEETRDERNLFVAALGLKSPADRAAYLTRACGDDTDMLTRVEELLKAHENIGDFLETPNPDIGGASRTSQLTEGAGTVIGPYRLLELIGEGGFGAVYMAEQEEPIRRRVALKIIKLGMDTKQVIARFEVERQALAMMDHPNIARVLDAGATDSGRPYFVMELVTGVSIIEYCDANKLSIPERLRLFVQVCNAVQHAHQKGIIHRDIKPSNVMVTLHDGMPTPKVIDFGIAKATNQRLTEKTLSLRYLHVLGTPAYMSPEQAEMNGVDVDTRSDIYSLGVLLYELLTATTPVDAKELRRAGYVEMQRIIREDEPAVPSSRLKTMGQMLTTVAEQRKAGPEPLRKLIRGDLDWIVMKSLEKDRTRRYTTAAEFAADVVRHLNKEPVSAGPPSALYQLKKLVQRRRALVTATVAVAAALILGLVFSMTMYLRARRALSSEVVARAELQTVTDFLTKDLLASVYPEKAKSPEVTVRYLLEAASANLDKRFESSPLSEAAIRRTLGLTYQKMGDFRAAEPHLKIALAMRRRQLGEEDPSTLTSLNELGWLYYYQGRYPDAEPLLVNGYKARERVLGKEHPDTLESMANLGIQFMYHSRFEEGMTLSEKALAIGLGTLGEEHPVTLRATIGFAIACLMTYQDAEVEPRVTAGLEISRRILGDEHETTVYLTTILSAFRRRQGRYNEARELALRALDIGERTYGEYHPATIQAINTLGTLYAEQGKHEEAVELQTRSVELCERFLGDSHLLTPYFTLKLSILYNKLGQHERQEALLVRAMEMSRRIHGENHPQTGFINYWLRMRKEQLGLDGPQQYEAGDYKEALATFTRLEKIRQVYLGKTSPLEVGYAAMCLHGLGREREARAELEKLRLMYDEGEHAHEESYLYGAERLLSQDDSAFCKVWDLIEAGELEQASAAVAELQARPYQDDLATVTCVRSAAKALARAYCLRGKKAELAGEYGSAASRYEAANRVLGDYALPLCRLAWMRAACPADEIRDGVEAVRLATMACELADSNNVECISIQAAAHAEAGDFAAAIELQRAAVEMLAPHGGHRGLYVNYMCRLLLYEQGKPFHMQNEESVIAWWKLDEVVGGRTADASGNAHDGELVGDAKIVVDVERGGVLALGGSGHVDCGAAPAFDATGPITVTAWIKVGNAARSDQAIVTKGNTAWRLQRFRGTNNIHFTCTGLEIPNDDLTALTGTKNVNDGAWHLVAGVRDGIKMSLYIDGELDVSIGVDGAMDINDKAVHLGGCSEGSPRHWNGLIDDVRIYDYGLSEAQIRALYADGAVQVAGRGK